MPRRGFFPNSLQDLAVLQWAVARDESDYRGWCDLGNLLFSKRRYDEAIRCWEQSRDLAHDCRPAATQSRTGVLQQARRRGRGVEVARARRFASIQTTPACFSSSISLPSG